MELGIGRGDSSRRVLGKKPVTRHIWKTRVKTFRELTAGRKLNTKVKPSRFRGRSGSPPVWIAGYGPKVSWIWQARIADGVILQFADPTLIAWCLGFVEGGREAAGRDSRKIEIMRPRRRSGCPTIWRLARERVRWFPALGVQPRRGPDLRATSRKSCPQLTSYVRNRGGYDYHTIARWIATMRILFPMKCRPLLPGRVREAHRDKLKTLAEVV